MPQYRAHKTFGTDKSKYGLVRTGMVVTMPAADAAKFNRANPGALAEYYGPALPPDEPAPVHAQEDNAANRLYVANEAAPRNAAHSEAPRTADDDDDEGDGGNDEPARGMPEDGTGKPSSVSRRGRPSRKKTPRKSRG